MKCMYFLIIFCLNIYQCRAGLGFLFIWALELHDAHYPCNLGPITTLVLLYCLICSCYGYIDSSHGPDCENNKYSWVRHISCKVLFLVIPFRSYSNSSCGF